MIAYKESDVIEPPEKNPAEQQFMQQFPKTCGYVKEDHPDESQLISAGSGHISTGSGHISAGSGPISTMHTM